MLGTTAVGATVIPHDAEDDWHHAAVEWWVALASGIPSGGSEVPAVPTLSPGEHPAHPTDRAATVVDLHPGRDKLTVSAETAGWAWLRVPWDRDWRSLHGTPVRLGGPGHLLVWASAGETELRWSVPGSVDVAAAVTTGTAALAAALLSIANRRRGLPE